MDFYRSSREMRRSVDHTSKLAETLNKQRVEQPEICDLTIRTEGKMIKAHWCVMVSCPYFESMYHSGLAEKTSGTVTILVGKRYAVEAVIQYLYVGKCEISIDNIEDILEVADYLQCLEVRQLCDDFLVSYPLDQKSCVKICLISSLYDLGVSKTALNYLKGHLPEIMESDDMLALNEESVLSLLTDETLRYVSQEIFLQFITRWLKHDFENRKDYITKMFQSINYINIRDSDLEELLNDEKLKDLIPKNKVKEIVENRKKKPKIVEESNMQREVILIGGGSNRNKDHGYAFNSQWLFVYDLEEGHWSKLWNTPRVECNKPIIKMNSADSTLYVIGTATTTTSYSYNERYNLFTFDLNAMYQWNLIKLPALRHLENFDLHDLIVCSSGIYLLGIGSKAQRLFPLTCKLIRVDAWGVQECIELFDCSSKDIFYGSAIDENRIALVCELFSEKTYSIKYYDLKEKALSTPNRTKSCSSTVSYTKIMMNDGKVIQLDLKKRIIRKFSPKENTWFCYPKIAVPPVELTNAAMYSFRNDQLFVLGGETTRRCYKYECRSKIWSEIESLPIGDSVLYNCATNLITLPAKLLTCHPDCPHCFYQPKWGPICDPMSDSECSENEDCYNYDDSDDWDDPYDDERSSRSECSLM